MKDYHELLIPFFENPEEEYHIRKVARILDMNHMTVRKYLQQGVKKNLLVQYPGQIYPVYKANETSEGYRNLKLFFNLEKIRQSGILDFLEDMYAFPTVLLFGSYAKAEDACRSDIDLCVISSVKRTVSLKRFEKHLHRPVDMHLYSKKEWKHLQKTNPELLNNMLNGIVLLGAVECEF